jgi:hypothetical protein
MSLGRKKVTKEQEQDRILREQEQVATRYDKTGVFAWKKLIARKNDEIVIPEPRRRWW